MPIQSPQNPFEDRITAILRERAAPAQPVVQNDVISGLTNASLYGPSSASDLMDRIGSVRRSAIEDQDRQFTASLNLAQTEYDLFEKQLAAGNRDAQAVQEAAAMFTSDPVGQSRLIQALVDDPEEIDPQNRAKLLTKISGIVRSQGIQTDFDRTESEKRARLSPARAMPDPRVSGPIRSGTGGNAAPVEPKKTGGTGAERMLSRYTELEGKRRQSGLTIDEQIEHQALENEINPAARETSKARGKAEAKIIQEINENALQSGPALQQLEGVEASIKKLGDFGQGPFIGILPNVTTAAQTLDAQSTKDALQFVSQTKGAVSDREMAMFKQASVGTNKNRKFNENYVQAARSALIRQQQQQQFFNAYNEAYGSLEGAYEAFKEFADDNPIFEWDGTNIVTLKTPEQVLADESYLNYVARAPKRVQERTQRVFGLQQNPANIDIDNMTEEELDAFLAQQ